jgi:hypothetical protein
MRQGANFCDNCGSEGGRHARARKPSNERKYAYALLFLIVLGAAGFAAYKYFSGDIDLTEIISSIKRENRDANESVNVAVPDADEPRPASDDISSANVLESVQPLYPDAPVSVEAVPEEDVPPPAATDADGPEYAWSERDAGGYSTLVASDRFFTSTQIPSTIGVVSGDRVRLRSAHNLNGNIVDQFDAGVSFDVVRRYSSDDEKYCWYEVRREGAEGWIYGEFLKVLSTTSP